MESTIISRLGTSTPNGLNIRQRLHTASTPHPALPTSASTQPYNATPPHTLPPSLDSIHVLFYFDVIQIFTSRLPHN